MDFGTAVALSALVKKIVDFAKYAMNADLNACVTQIVAWLVGIAVVMLTATSDLGTHIAVAGTSLESLNGWIQAFVGANLASLAGFGWDTLKSVDNSNSAAVPDLFETVRTRQAPSARPVTDS
jgi:hypothetical protein